MSSKKIPKKNNIRNYYLDDLISLVDLIHPGKYEDDNVIEALAEYEKLSLELKVPMGYHIVEPDSDKFLEMRDKGYTILALSFDAMYLGTIARQNIEKIRATLI